MIVLPLCVTVTVSAVNVAVQLASHSCPIDISKVLPRAGKMWATRAAGGKCGKFNSAVCVAIIVSWLGNLTFIPLLVGFLLVVGAIGVRKWPVLPVLRMNMWLAAEGPSVSEAVRAVWFVTVLFTWLVAVPSMTVLGSLHLHSVWVIFSVGVSGDCFRFFCRSLYGTYWKIALSFGMRQ